MIEESPFKFLDSYTKDDKEIFFGRDQEIDEVYNKVFQDKTLFVYGESGTGKSSLINCGLANKFKETDWLPVNVRRGENINDALLSELEKISLTPVENLNGSFQKNLFKYTRSIYLDYFKPIYFIFDQFEELYLMGTKNEWKEFIGGIKSLAERDLHVHFIFIIRAEYLHFMSEFEEELPEIFHNKLRIEKITRMKARECIEGPCRVFGIQVDPDFPDQLFDQLSPDRNDIELTYLQVFLDRIYKLAKDEAQEPDTIIFSKELLDKIGMVSDVLSDFLDEQIDALPDKETSLTVLKAFVTTDGTKRQASLDDILSFARSLGQDVEQKKVDDILRELLERRILKELPDQDKFELRHDALAFKIFEKITTREKELIEVRQFLDYGLVEYKKRNYLLNERDISYVQPHLEVLNLDGEVKIFVEESLKSVQKKQRTRKRVIGVVSIIVVLCITSIYGFITARQQRATAEEQRQVAEEQRLLAEKNADEAQLQKNNAEQNAEQAFIARQEAEANAEEASTQATIANQQRNIANAQRAEAVASREEAELQRLQALIQKDSAETARARALTYLGQANAERTRAENLSKQSLARTLGIKAAQLPDLEQKSLLALQAYQFNLDYEGYAYQSDIYNGLYQAYKQAQGEQFNVFRAHSRVNAILNHDSFIYTTGSEGKVVRWSSDLSNRKVLAETGTINNAMAIAKDGQTLAIGTSANDIILLNAASGTEIQRLQGHRGEVWDLLFIDNETLLSSGEDHRVISWDLKTQQSSDWQVFPENAYAMAFHPATNKLWTGLENGQLRELDSTGRELVIDLRPGDKITSLEFNYASTLLAVGFESGTILLFDPGSYEVVETLPGHTAHVSDIKFSSDDRFLISGAYDRRNLLWNMQRIKEPPIAWTDHESSVWAVGFAENQSEIIAGELNGAIRKYHLHMSGYAEEMCDQVTRNLTKKEWETFVRDDIPYEETCITKSDTK